MNSLEMAVISFHSEYGRLPAVGSPVSTDGAAGVRFLSILLGNEAETEAKQNPRNIKFLSVREGRNGKGGIEYDATGRVLLVHDKWGNPYTVVLNTGMEDPWRVTHGGREVNCRSGLAFIYTPGPDGKAGTKDDVTSARD